VSPRVGATGVTVIVLGQLHWPTLVVRAALSGPRRSVTDAAVHVGPDGLTVTLTSVAPEIAFVRTTMASDVKPQLPPRAGNVQLHGMPSTVPVLK
jgi:hypothetical protein